MVMLILTGYGSLCGQIGICATRVGGLQFEACRTTHGALLYTVLFRLSRLAVDPSRLISMSSASSDSWSQPDLDALSEFTSPMSDTVPLVPETHQRASPAPEVGPDDASGLKRSRYYMSEDDIFTAVVHMVSL